MAAGRGGSGCGLAPRAQAWSLALLLLALLPLSQGGAPVMWLQPVIDMDSLAVRERACRACC